MMYIICIIWIIIGLGVVEFWKPVFKVVTPPVKPRTARKQVTTRWDRTPSAYDGWDA